MKSVRVLPLAVLAFASIAHADKKEDREAEIAQLAKEAGDGAAIAARNPDETVVDLLTKAHTIQVAWPERWADAVGHALNDAAQREGRRPQVVLLDDGTRAAARNLDRCERACRRAGVMLVVRDVNTHKSAVRYKPDEHVDAGEAEHWHKRYKDLFDKHYNAGLAHEKERQKLLKRIAELEGK